MKRIRRDRGVLYYTLAKKTILSNSISLKAKAMLTILLNLPEGWHFTVAGILPSVQEGREAVMSALKELESGGYLTITPLRDAKGRILGREYTVRELLPDAPEAEKPTSDYGQQHITIEKAQSERKEITSNKEIIDIFSQSRSKLTRVMGRKTSGGSVIAQNEIVKAAMKKEGDEKEKGGVGE